MEVGRFYFLSEDYFIKFPDKYIMNNKETVGGVLHDRLCFYSFKDENTGIFWMIPFSSKVTKYKKEWKKKIDKYHFCNTILFGEILGHQKAFLIQNMCPVTSKYIKNEYLDSLHGVPVGIDYKFQKKLTSTAKSVLMQVKKGNSYIVFPDILNIEKALLEELHN